MKTIGLTGAAVAAFLLCLPATGRAQGEIEWGMKGGLNISSLRGASSSFDTKRAVVVGGFGVFNFAPEFSVEVDALFDMKGAKMTAVGLDANGNAITISEGFLVLDYLEVPILARLNTPALGSLKTHVYAGPTIAFKLSARGEFAGVLGVDLDAVRSVDSGVAFGVGADLPLREYKLVFDARYGLGLTNAMDWGGPDVKNDAFSLMAGLAF